MKNFGEQKKSGQMLNFLTPSFFDDESNNSLKWRNFLILKWLNFFKQGRVLLGLKLVEKIRWLYIDISR